MKRTRFSEEQIIGVLKEAEAGVKTADLARRHGVSEATRRRRSRRRAGGTRAPAPVLALPNQRWSLELGATRPSSLRFESVHDQMASGRRFRVLNVVDD
ncbi:transposase, partial [Aurantiacibacter flavus]